jgi:hypothetical protein
MEKRYYGLRWRRLLGVEAVMAAYVSYMLLNYVLRGPVGAPLVSLLALVYFASALICGNSRPQIASSTAPPSSFKVFCWLLAFVEVLVYSRIRYGL